MRDRTKDPRFQDLTGMQFGKWTVLEYSGKGGGKCPPSLWKCECECGTVRDVVGPTLKNGSSKDCGCGRNMKTAERSTVHGHAKRDGKHPLYDTWTNMIDRCENTSNSRYHRYGGRGISICPEWRASFTAFLAGVGERPSEEHSLDRFPDNNGNYEPGNIRWATETEQQQNKGANVNIEINGEVICATEAGRRHGLSHGLICSRIKRGWDRVEAATKPPKKMAKQIHTAYGITLSLREWSEKLGVPYTTLHGRLAIGMSPEDAFSATKQALPFTALSRTTKD